MNNGELDIYSKSYAFAKDLVLTSQKVRTDHINRSLVSQLIRSGTSISANLQEADVAPTRKDFVNKLATSIKEARETIFWLQLMRDAGYLTTNDFQRLFDECQELTKILTSIRINSCKPLQA
jgi:four helix bundle protein